ncbi:MAG: NAD-dependent protein deacylase [Candidatus Gerdarchaeota archaeon]|nr:MAG: NAD-dependent protein deacylase [Candidatus Gerdarchaeota archaeon]RLI68751.1 MAG: NAD-dependent protein deacylase [Candidatus Gerdarchaeota archaeon]
MNQLIDEVISLVEEVRERKKFKAYVLTGSGISRASGIPTFRGEDGLWEKYDFEEVATYDAWVKNPEKLWEFYREGIDLILNSEPNNAHYAVAKLEEMGFCQSVITQNADGLHQRAGSKNVYEVHGNLTRVVCPNCGMKAPFQYNAENFPPHCSCGSLLRPDVVLFGETLPTDILSKVFSIAKTANLVFVVGTSAEVYPIASLPHLSKRNRARVVVFNIKKTSHAQIADVFIQGKCEETLPKLVEKLVQKE